MISEVETAKPFVIRDLRHGREAGPPPSSRYRFASNFAARCDLALAVQRNYFEGGADIGEHRGEDFYSLYIVRGGRGVEIVNAHPYVISRGDVYIVPAGMAHGFRDYEALEMDAFYFQIRLFTRGELIALREMAGFWELFVPRRAQGAGKFRNQRLHLTLEQHRTIETAIEEIRAEMCDPQSVGPFIARGLFFGLLGTLARWHSVEQGAEGSAAEAPAGPATANASGPHLSAMAAAMRFCEENFHQELTVPQMAAGAFLSPDHFSRLFSAHAGVSPSAYIRRLRLERAQSLLRSSALDIAAIARQCGFGGVTQLSRTFHAAFGCTPTAYRKSFREPKDRVRGGASGAD